jgi:hypothetical protein
MMLPVLAFFGRKKKDFFLLIGHQSSPKKAHYATC